MKAIIATVVILVGMILLVAALLAPDVGDVYLVWGIAGWASLLVVVNWVLPSIVIARSNSRSRQVGVLSAVEVVLLSGSVLSLIAMGVLAVGMGMHLTSTSHLLAQVLIIGITLALMSMCFVAAAAAEPGGGPLTAESRDQLLANVKAIQAYVMSSHPSLTTVVQSVDSQIRHKTPHPTRIVNSDDYLDLITVTGDKEVFQLDDMQLGLLLSAIQEKAVQLR